MTSEPEMVSVVHTEIQLKNLIAKDSRNRSRGKRILKFM
jgi:hypothetical protein